MEERLQKILSRAGYGSRRACEAWIVAGRVTVNGVVATLGGKADPERDTILVDGQPMRKLPTNFVYIALHKPRGVLSDSGAAVDRKTVRDLVSHPGHLFTVGRLDYDSEGLILLTNDGELANLLTHPRYGHEKEYRVLVMGCPDERQLAAMRYGVVLEDGHRTAPAQVEIESRSNDTTWLCVILREGRKRQIREMGQTIGVSVVRIQRVRIGSLLLGNLKPGEWRYLSGEEVRRLRAASPKAAARPPMAKKSRFS